MSDGFAGSVAVVTGGNRGIGRAIALAFGQAGAAVAIGARDKPSLERVASELREAFAARQKGRGEVLLT